jgi:hypothetical protein
VAFQVHGDVGLEIADEFGGVLIGAGGHVEEAVEGFHQARAHVAAVVRAEGDAKNFETPAVVNLEQFSDKIRSGVAMEVSGEKGNADPVAGKIRRFPCARNAKNFCRAVLRTAAVPARCSRCRA